MDRVLFACDFSSCSTRALSYAVDLVERTGATLHVMHVEEVPMGPFVKGDPSPESSDPTLEQQVAERCRDVLDGHALAPTDDRVSYVVERRGAVAPALVQYAEENDVDLIAMGTHGRRGMRRAVFGSVAEEVLRTARCPVLTTRTETEEAEQRPAGPASVERIVVPVDFSDPSRSALRYAARLAPVYEAPMTLLHVVHLPTLPTVYDVEFAGVSVEDVRTRARSALEEWGASVSAEGLDISYRLEQGKPVPTILRAASSPDDLVITATHGLSGLMRTMLGSVAEGILRRAPGPVISGRTFPSIDDKPLNGRTPST